MNEYDGRQFVGIDLHRQRSVIVRQSDSGEQLSAVRVVNDPVALGLGEVPSAFADAPPLLFSSCSRAPSTSPISIALAPTDGSYRQGSLLDDEDLLLFGIRVCVSAALGYGLD